MGRARHAPSAVLHSDRGVGCSPLARGTCRAPRHELASRAETSRFHARRPSRCEFAKQTKLSAVGLYSNRQSQPGSLGRGCALAMLWNGRDSSHDRGRTPSFPMFQRIACPSSWKNLYSSNSHRVPLFCRVDWSPAWARDNAISSHRTEEPCDRLELHERAGVNLRFMVG